MAGASQGVNEAYIEQLLEDYLDAPASVPREWQELFAAQAAAVASPGVVDRDGNGQVASVPPPAPEPPPPEPPLPEPAPPPPPIPEPPAPEPPEPAARAELADATLLAGVAAAMALVKAYRMHGHLAAHLDPLRSEPMGDPALEETSLNPPLTPELQERIPARLLRLYVPGETLRDALPHLKEVYTGTIAYEIEHISDHAERVWLRQAIESGRYRGMPSPEERRALLQRLSQAEAFEQYLRRTYIGQKQFSLEGLDVLVPMLDLAIDQAAEDGAHEIVVGMAHRGRLNALAHTVGRPYESILREFEGERTLRRGRHRPRGRLG